MMRVAVTGASGFIGGTIARTLEARGMTVFAFGRRPESALTAPLPRYAAWDVAAGPREGPEVDAVVHCAAHVGQWGDERTYHAVNVTGTAHVLATFPRARRVVYVSTASVYAADAPGVQLTEAARTGGPSLTPYARTKAEGERLVAGAETPAVILRPHIVYGPGDATLWPRVVAARRLGWLLVPGDGRNRLSVTHVSNLAHAVALALRDDAPPGVYNVSDGEDPSVDELLRTMLRRHELPVRVAYLPRAAAWPLASAAERIARAIGRRHEPVLTRYVVAHLADECTLDITRARRLLGYSPSAT
ncbi:MAG TPA: NAD(P)-dependent oxidoreductase, partial [Gemmatimonadales bacterium]|nr:NAD(P)-dependent oxidoreductase [Gemmatimonadales bacterium]